MRLTLQITLGFLCLVTGLALGLGAADAGYRAYCTLPDRYCYETARYGPFMVREVGPRIRHYADHPPRIVFTSMPVEEKRDKPLKCTGLTADPRGNVVVGYDCVLYH